MEFTLRTIEPTSTAEQWRVVLSANISDKEVAEIFSKQKNGEVELQCL